MPRSVCGCQGCVEIETSMRPPRHGGGMVSVEAFWVCFGRRRFSRLYAGEAFVLVLVLEDDFGGDAQE